jgi:hypothetical protein
LEFATHRPLILLSHLARGDVRENVLKGCHEENRGRTGPLIEKGFAREAMKRKKIMRSTFFNRSARFGALLVLATGASLAPGAAVAQESDDTTFRISPYIWALGLDGTTAALGQDVPVDASFGDIFDKLNMALMVNMEWKVAGPWFLILDPMWSDLESDFSAPGPLPVSGSIEVQMVIADGIVGYELNDHFDVYAGARYFDQDITITPDGVVGRQKLGDSWTDIVLGVRMRSEISEKWIFSGRADVAVSGGSESAYYIQAVVGRRFSDGKHLDLGWRHYDVDYESGAGISRFKWDVAHSGPMIGFSWEF